MGFCAGRLEGKKFGRELWPSHDTEAVQLFVNHDSSVQFFYGLEIDFEAQREW